MTHEESPSRSQRLIRLYGQFRERFDREQMAGRHIQYDWWKLPDPLNGQWIFYSLKLDEYARELANIINRLTIQVDRLRAWSIVVQEMDDDQKFEVAHEFVEDIGTVSLSLPYAIKSRFTFAAAHLSHEANPAIGVSDKSYEIPNDANLYLNHLDPICREWRSYRKLKRCVEPIAGTAFNRATSEFRHAYNHRFPRRFLFGHTSQFSRSRDEQGNTVVGFGTLPPLELETICNLLNHEAECCYRAFDAFQEFVNEQTEAIGKYGAIHE